MQRDTKSSSVHENLDTSYVNLAALLRYLQQRDFVGRVHIELDEYDADVFLKAGDEPRVRETDHATGREAQGAEALRRLLVRATAPGGLVSIYEGAEEVEINDDAASPDASAELHARMKSEPGGAAHEATDGHELVRLSGELIAAVERAALSVGADFVNIFRAVRLELADDYSFLDPSTARFEYASGTVRLHAQPSANAYVGAVCESLRRVVDRIARGEHGRSVRERVALELAVLARRRQTQFVSHHITSQLERIAGTRVL